MIGFKEIKDSLLNVLFPHICDGCGTDIIDEKSNLCIQCIAGMPETNFHLHANNPIEKIFWGRLPVIHATAQYYFIKESLIQRLMHQLKYRGNKELGKQLGRLMGYDLQQSERFNKIEFLVPLPLFPSKEKKRGYNQATILCEGISEVTGIEIAKDIIIRTQHTDTQTKKGRIERWKNMEGKFELVNPEKIRNKSILLVDDVITTGATLEACGQELAQTSAKVNIATLCYAGGN
jgi:ComF family protein